MSARIYTIAALAREFGVSGRALRFWEEKGLIAPCRRGRGHGSQRIYSQTDCETVAGIVWGRSLGLSIAELQALARLDGVARACALEACLAAHLRRLQEQRDAIERALAELRARTRGPAR